MTDVEIQNKIRAQIKLIKAIKLLQLIYYSRFGKNNTFVLISHVDFVYSYNYVSEISQVYCQHSSNSFQKIPVYDRQLKLSCNLVNSLVEA